MKALAKLTFILWLLGSVLPGRAQELATFKGLVRDAQSGAPLAFADVVLVGTRFGAATDEAGRFSMLIPPGAYTVRISMIGYAALTQRVELRAALVEEGVFKLQRKPIVIEEVVVTAEGEPSCPCAEMSSQEIHESCCCRDVGELFRAIPGASAVKRGGTALDPVFRGSQGEQLNVTIDGGVHVNGACPNRMDPPSFHVEAEDLEKVEVIKGPYAVRFGPAIGGVVNLIMARPKQISRFEMHGKLETNYESAYLGRKGRLSLWGGSRGYDFRLDVGREHYGNYEDGRGREVPSEFRTTHYAMKVGANLSPGHRLQFSHRQSFARDLLYPALPMDADRDDTQMFALDYRGGGFHHRLESISAKAYFSRVDHLMSNTRRPNHSMVHAVTDVKTQTLGGRIEGVVRAGSGALLSIGADYSDLEKDGVRTRDFVAGPMAGKHFDDVIWPDAEMKDLGFFAELRHGITPKIFSTLGARLDLGQSRARHLDPAFPNGSSSSFRKSELAWSGSAHLSHHLAEPIEVGVTVGRGVRFPSITERYIYLLPVGLDRYDYLGSPTLKPEENWQGELTLESRYGRISFEGSMFYSRLVNYISARVEPGLKPRSPDVLGVKRYSNLHRASKIGGELQIAAKVTSALSVQGILFYARGTNNDTSEPLPEMPPLEGQLRIRYEAFNGRGWVQFMGRWAAEQNRISKAFGETATPGFGVVNLRVGMRIARLIEVVAAVENLLDEAYYEHLNRKSRTDMVPLYEPGRNIALGLSLEM